LALEITIFKKHQDKLICCDDFQCYHIRSKDFKEIHHLPNEEEVTMLLGAIGDDFTGSTDLANTLVRQGMRTVQLIGIPDDDLAGIEADAVVIALKSRTIDVNEAVKQSLAALDWLKIAGCRQFFFKYCSTFDSTDVGNIGPVAKAMLQALDSDFTIACPAFPENERTVFKGHLFVGDVLLSDSGMKNHPLTPMTDSNLVRVLGRQVKDRVGLVKYDTVEKGVKELKKAFDGLRKQGIRFAVVDAINDAQLFVIGEALENIPLITGGSGVAVGLPENFRRQGLLESRADSAALPDVKGKEGVISGSCSVATQDQVPIMKRTHPARKLDILALAVKREREIDDTVQWALPLLDKGPVLIYTTDAPEAVQFVQQKLGSDRAGEIAENAHAQIACRLIEAGVRRLIVAGGETSGAVVNALNIKGLRIGPQIDPGVPWTTSLKNHPIALSLKSGNFGSPDFFLKAFTKLG
jgi:uncharacterized protein YgbK (DUF1537 family)